MAKPAAAHETSYPALLVRVLTNGQEFFPEPIARYLLKVAPSDADKARMHDLAVRNQSDALSAEEKAELMNWVKVGDLLALLQSRARRSLRKKQAS